MTGTADLAQFLPLGSRNKIGLLLCGLLGLGDVAGLFAIGRQDANAAGPPAAVLAVGGVLGVLTVAGVLFTWRTHSRRGARAVAGARVLSAITALPAFFVGGVSDGVVAIAGAGIVITLAAVWLLLARPTAT